MSLKGSQSIILSQLSNAPRSIILDCPGNAEARDRIKNARREDDPRFSQGVWQTPLKKADWPVVEELCLKHIQTPHKAIDVQILGWLVESWIAQHGLTGILEGLFLLQMTLSGEFIPLENEDEWEMITDWMDVLWADRLVKAPLLPGIITESLSQWLSAVQLENALETASEKEKSLIQTQLLKQKSTRQLQAIMQPHQDILQQNLKKCDEYLGVVRRAIPKDLSALSAHLKTLQEIMRPLEKQAIQTDQLMSPAPPAQHYDQPVAAHNLSEIYEQLQAQANALKQLEPQGIVHLFLKKLLLYKGCSQIEFFQSLSEKPEDITVFLRFLDVQSPQKSLNVKLEKQL